MSLVAEPTVKRARVIRTESDAVQPIAGRLQQLLSRIKRVILLRGLLGVAAAALGVVLVLMGIDALFVIESTLLRAMISLAGLSAVLSAAWWFIIRPLKRRLSLTTVARMVEIHHPELQERVSSALELLSAPTDGRGSRGSEQLIAALAAEASLDVRSFDPRREVGFRTLRPYMIAACVLASTLLLIVALWPRQSATLLMRLVAPNQNLDRIQALSLLVDPGEDRVVPLGDPLTISVRAGEGRLKQPVVRLLDSTGQEVRQPMQSKPATTGNEAFAYSCGPVLESFAFSVQDGRAWTRTYKITAVARPKIEQVRVRFDFPAYAGLPAGIETEVRGPIVAPQGTRLLLTAKCDRPVSKPILSFAKSELPGQAVPNAKPANYSWTVPLEKEGPATLSLADEHGIASQPFPLEFKLLADQPPQVRITDPMRSHITLKPTEKFALQYAAVEDFGFSTAELLVAVDEGAASEVSLSLPTTDNSAPTVLSGEKRTWTGKAPLDLGDFASKKPKRLTVRVRVRDNRPAPAGPQVAVSPPLEITFDAAADSWTQNKVKEQGDVFIKAVQDIIDGLKEVQPAADAAAAQPGESGQPSEQQRHNMEKVGDATKTAGNELRDAVKQFDGTLFEPLVPDLKSVADQPVKGAEENNRQAQGNNNPQQRQQQNKAAAGDIAKAIEQLQSLLNKMPQHLDDLNNLAMLEDLLGKQQDVVNDINKELQQGTPQDQPPSDQPWRKIESDVAEQLEKMKGKQGKPKDSSEESGEGKGKGKSPGMGMSPGMGDMPGMGESPGMGMGMGKSPGMGMGLGDPLSQAQSQASQASTAPSTGQAQGPAMSALQSLGQAAASMAQGMGVPSIASAPSPGPPGQSANAPPGPMGAQGTTAGGPTARHTDAKFKPDAKEWIIWRGLFSGNAAVDTRSATPSDFQDIVTRYFSELSHRGGGVESERK